MWLIKGPSGYPGTAGIVPVVNYKSAGFHQEGSLTDPPADVNPQYVYWYPHHELTMRTAPWGVASKVKRHFQCGGWE